MPTEMTTAAVGTFELPGEAVFPESVGVDLSTGDAYVGSLADGTLYRLTADGEVETWSPAGEDQRSSVAGVKRSRNFARQRNGCGRRAAMTEPPTSTKLLIARCWAASTWARDRRASTTSRSGPAGEAYVTDSFVPLLFRAAGEPLAIEPWIDLAEQGVPWSEGLNLNGIVLTA